MKTFPLLYKKAKTGAVQEWEIWAENGTVYVKWGQQHGAKQVSTEHCSPKNVGRANATTAQQQAESQALSKWKKQKDRGYRETVDDIDELVFLPMLANNKAIKREDKIPFAFPADVQPKLDGVRCLARPDGKTVELLSRKGKPYNQPHLREQLREILSVVEATDGEIYLHGSSLQQINRFVRPLDPVPGAEKLEYHIFDIPVGGMPWKDRRKVLQELEAKFGNKLPNIKFVPSYTVDRVGPLWNLHDKFASEGYEGLIVRLHDRQYEFNHRSSKLYKVKDFDEGDFEVIGFEGGTPGTKEEHAVKWICKTPEGKVFAVRPKGSIEEREEAMKTAQEYVGKMLSVKWQSGQLTEEGCPKFASGLGFKEDR